VTLPGIPAGQQTVRRHNLALVLAELARGPGSRAELAQRTGLTKATVASLVDALLAQAILVEADPESSGPGRPARALALDPGGPITVGVEINVDYTAACLLDLTGRLRSYRSIALDNRRLAPAEVVAVATGLCSEVREELGQPLLGIGLAVPGVVSPEGELLRAPNLPRFAGSHPGRRLAQMCGVDEVLVENEANLGALARLWSTPGGGQDFVYVSGEIGVGAGLVLGGRLFRGVHGYAGELGHVVVDRNGPMCGCGGQGCVEQYAGQEVLISRSGQPDLEALMAAIERGDRRASQAVTEAGSALGVGLSSLLNLLDVPTVVLGGVYARLFDGLMPAISRELRRRVLSSRSGGGQICRSSLGADAAARGAAGSVRDLALKHPDRLTGLVESSGSSNPSRTPDGGRARTG